jgi:poly-beta-1,6-N-acetyl-D-glucosamine synthase
MTEIAYEGGVKPWYYTYVLITPARNEAAFIEQTILSVVGQTVLPLKWVIVSDGSTDGTDDIVKKYAAAYPWIELLRMPDHRDRNFAAKVACFNAGIKNLKGIQYEFIGNLDADITFEGGYFEYLLGKFKDTPNLGVAGTPFVEGTFQYDYRIVNIEHVSGACQLFKRECFEDIGGYKPIKGGGIDWVAVTTARMRGWKTRTFTDKTCTHHRKIGTGKSTVLLSRFRFGKQDYYLGGHPLWEVFRCVYQMKENPYIIGGMLMFLGYIWACLSRVERPIPRQLIVFRRKEQMQRLRKIFIGIMRQQI